jgi:hypothetical protein
MAKKSVAKNPLDALTRAVLAFSIITFCVYVSVRPEVNRINVLRKGNPKAGIVSISYGGQTDPIQTLGTRLK